MAELRKYTVGIPVRQADLAVELAKREGMTMIEFLRHCITLGLAEYACNIREKRIRPLQHREEKTVADFVEEAMMVSSEAFLDQHIPHPDDEVERVYEFDQVFEKV